MKKFLIFILLSLSTLSFAETSLHVASGNGVEYHHYNFGNVKVGFNNPISYRVTNDGTTDLVFQRATIQGIFYTAYHSCNKTLAPKGTCSFTINYLPMFEGFHYGSFRLTFDQGNEIVVDLSGWAQN